MAKVNFDVNKQNQQTSVEAAATFGWTLYKKGMLNEAGEMLQAVLNTAQINQLGPDSQFYVAQILADRNKPGDALAVLDIALQKPVFFNKAEAEALKKKLQAGGASSSAPASSVRKRCEGQLVGSVASRNKKIMARRSVVVP
ncbi:MAG: hypothetical protein QM811_30540 [Pirellulales bacterium]